MPVADQRGRAREGLGKGSSAEGQKRCAGAPLETQAPSRDCLVWHFPTSGVIMWSPVRKASGYTRFLAGVPSLGHLIAETVSSLASGLQWPRA
jgi:hypothetical protein